jgi:hypothetical protein
MCPQRDTSRKCVQRSVWSNASKFRYDIKMLSDDGVCAWEVHVGDRLHSAPTKNILDLVVFGELTF